MTNAQRLLNAKRETWRREMYSQGKRIVSVSEANALADVTTLLCLALRRLENPFVQKPLQDKILAVYEEARAENARTLTERDFNALTFVAQPANILSIAEWQAAQEPREETQTDGD